MANRTVTVTLQAKTTGLVAGLATARKSVADFGGEMDTLAAKQSGRFNSMTTKAAVFGAGLTLAFVSVLKAAYEFDKEMSRVGAVTDANTEQFDALRKAAINAGAATAYTATQAAQAEEELAKAGVSVKDILSGGLTGALSLAAAGGLDLADAATIAAQAMNQFALGGKSVGHVADVLTAGANKSATDVQALGDSLSQVGGVAHQAGLSLDGTIGVLALFAQQGMVGEEAGTAFKTMLLKLENPTEKAASLMQELGLKVYDQAGNFLDAASLAGQLQKALGGLTNEQRNAALGTIFGTRAVRGAVALYNAGADGVQKWTDAVNDSGLAARTAAKMQDNLAGDVEKLKGSLDTLAIQSSGGATKGLRAVTEAATGTVNVISGMPTAVTSTLTVLTGLGGASTLAAAGFLKARSTVKDFFEVLSNAGPTGAKAATALGKIGKVAGGLAIAGVAVGGLVEGFEALHSWAVAKEHPTQKQIDALSKSLGSFAQSASVSGELATRFGKDLRGLAIDIDKVAGANKAIADIAAIQANADKLHPALAGFGGRATQAQINQQIASTRDQRKAIEELDGALTQMVNNGGANQAAIMLQNLTAAAGLNYQQVAALQALLPNYNKAAGDSAAANAAAAQGFGTSAANAQALASSLSDLIAKGQTFLDVFKQLNGAAISAKQADIGFQQSIDDLSAALDKQSPKVLRGKKAWDDNTQAGRDNNSMVITAIQKASEHAESVYEQTQSVDDATAAWNKDIDALKATLRQAGLTDAQIQALIDTYASMPPAVKTPVSAPGLSQVYTSADAYLRTLERIDGKHVSSTVTTHYHTTGGPSAQRWGGAYEHAATGLLRDASVYSATNPGRYMIAEPQTGGEAFVPKRGDYGRSMGILSHAASWYGASVVPGGMGGGGSVNITVTPVNGIGAAFMQFLRFEINQRGGDPVATLSPRGA